MKTAKKALQYERIEEHGAKLNKIFNTKYGNIELCKKLRMIETKAHRFAEDCCNGLYQDEKEERKREKDLIRMVDRVLDFEELGIPVFLNGDPRGYALKIDNEYIRERNLDIDRDWGGYGLIAPEIK